MTPGRLGMGNGPGRKRRRTGVHLKDNGKESFWKGLFGVGVRELWEEYGRYLDGLGGQEGEKKRTASESTSNDHESRN